MKKQYGAAFLVVAVFLIVVTLLTMVYFTRFSNQQQQTAANQYVNSQVFEAAEAGLEFGIANLQTNSATILASPVGGFINYALSPVTLANGTTYTVTYTNPTANNYYLIKISSLGSSADGTSTHTVTQLVYRQSLIANLPTNTMTSIGPINISGSANIKNLEGPVTIRTGSTVDISGSGNTTTSTGGSDKSHIGADIEQNVSNLQTISPSDFFYSYFGINETTMMGLVDHFYASGTIPNLDGLTGTTIWVDDDLSLTGNDTIGSTTNPVLLIVNGNFSMRGTTTIYGLVFTIRGSDDVNVSDLGNSKIIGSLITSATNVDFSGNSSLTYDSSILNLVKNQSIYVAKVPGSWKDF